MPCQRARLAVSHATRPMPLESVSAMQSLSSSAALTVAACGAPPPVSPARSTSTTSHRPGSAPSAPSCRTSSASRSKTVKLDGPPPTRTNRGIAGCLECVRNATIFSEERTAAVQGSELPERTGNRRRAARTPRTRSESASRAIFRTLPPARRPAPEAAPFRPDRVMSGASADGTLASVPC